MGCLKRAQKWNETIFMKIEKLENIEVKFRALERKLVETNYPDNLANKSMGMIFESIHSFELIMTRFRINRTRLQALSIESSNWWKKHPKAKSRKAHPAEDYVNRAMRVDVESLFMYGLILTHRTLLLIKLFLPEKPKEDKFGKLKKFYHWLSAGNSLPPLAEELNKKLGSTPKWLYAVLRFYRNEFVEHLDRSYQQGMGFSVYGNSFRLSSYKWDYSDEDTKKIITFKNKLIKRGVILPKEIRPRHYVQLMFNQIVDVPEDLLEEALDIIEDVGCDSPEPEQLISMVQDYLDSLFDFMIEHFDTSDFAKYPKNRI